MPLEKQTRWVIECEWCGAEEVGCRDGTRDDLLREIGGPDAWLIIPYPRNDAANLAYCPDCKEEAALEYLQKKNAPPDQQPKGG